MITNMSKNKEQTSNKAASLAGTVLGQNNTTMSSRSLAASALSQSGRNAQTSSEMASLAGKVLKQSTASPEAKKLAASVLTQTPDKKIN